MGGVLGAGGAVAGVVAASGGGSSQDGSGNTTAGGPAPTPSPTTTPTPPTTTMPSQPDLSGSWSGTAPDGLIITTAVECELEHDLFLDLTQSGTALGGTWRTVLRAPNPNPPPNSVCTNPVGTVLGPFPVSGTVGAGTVSFDVMIPAGGPGPVRPLTATFTGVFTATRMSGTRVCAPDCAQAGTWAVNRP